MENKNLIVVCGDPKTGKTTISKELLNILPNSILIETDWVLVGLIRKKVIKLSNKFKNYGKVLGQILLNLSVNEKRILHNEIKTQIEKAFLDGKTIITEGYLWGFDDYKKILDNYEEKIIINLFHGHGYKITYKEKAIFACIDQGIGKCVYNILNKVKENTVKKVSPFIRYQRFNFLGRGTDSDSIGKLNALKLPVSLEGLSVLDIGCNNGFFSFECCKRKAFSVVGIDKDELAIDVANVIKNSIFFDKNVNFLQKDVNDELIKIGKFNLILILSTFHYLENQKQLIDMFYEMLYPKGIIKLEMGIFSGFSNEVKVINGKYYPSMSKIKEYLKDYKYEINNSVNQTGDEIPRYVVTISK